MTDFKQALANLEQALLKIVQNGNDGGDIAEYEVLYRDFTTRYTPREEFVRDFHVAFGVDVESSATIELLELRRRLIMEEALETRDAINAVIYCMTNKHQVTKEEWIEVLDGMADLQVVLSGTAVAVRELRNFPKAFLRVHLSNMSKLGADGKPIYRLDGKVLKGPNFVKPILDDLVP